MERFKTMTVAMKVLRKNKMGLVSAKQIEMLTDYIAKTGKVEFTQQELREIIGEKQIMTTYRLETTQYDNNGKEVKTTSKDYPTFKKISTAYKLKREWAKKQMIKKWFESIDTPPNDYYLIKIMKLESGEQVGLATITVNHESL